MDKKPGDPREFSNAGEGEPRPDMAAFRAEIQKIIDDFHKNLDTPRRGSELARGNIDLNELTETDARMWEKVKNGTITRLDDDRFQKYYNDEKGNEYFNDKDPTPARGDFKAFLVTVLDLWTK